MAVTPNLDVRFGGIAMSRLMMMTAGLMMLAATVPAGWLHERHEKLGMQEH
jgi:hypothetical protein